MQPNECAKILQKQDNILIITHKNPDGDCLGSASALCSALRRLNKTAYIFNNPQITEKFLPYVSSYFAPEGFVPSYTVATDVASENMFSKGFSGSVDMCIDHHPTNTGYAPKLLLQGERSSCGEIVMKVIKLLCGDITTEEAELLYIALSTDTGCFQYSNTDASSLRAAAQLLDLGVDNNKLNTAFFRKLSPARLKLEGMIYDSMSFHRGGEVVISMVTQKMLKACGATENDLDDIAAITNRAEGSKVAVTIRELDDGSSKVSVRTSAGVSASEICAAFGGGGHPAASGCTISSTPDKAKKMLLAVIDEVMQ